MLAWGANSLTDTNTLNAQVRKRPPYEDTEVSYYVTKGQIEGMLRGYPSVKGVRWTSIEGQEDKLEIVVEAEIAGAKKSIAITVAPPHIIIPKKIKGKLVDTENINQEYRLLFYWIKSKMEAVTWGLTTIEQEFLSMVTFALPGGKSSTVGAMVASAIAKDNLQSLPFYEAHPGNSTASPPTHRLPPKDVTGQ